MSNAVATLHVTPSFEKALARLNGLCGATHGGHYAYTRGRGGRLYRRWVPSRDTPHEAAEALRALKHASDRHTIPCEPDELCEGDAILYVARKTEVMAATRRGPSRIRNRTYATYSPVAATITDIEVGATPHQTCVTLDLDIVENTLSAYQLTVNGCWRMPWTDEDCRAGIHAVFDDFRMRVRADMARCDRTPMV